MRRPSSSTVSLVTLWLPRLLCFHQWYSATAAATPALVAAQPPPQTTMDRSFPHVTLTRATFGSCHKQEYQDDRIWRTIARQNAQAWLWLGDAVYPPQRRIAPVQALRDEYQALAASSSYQSALVQHTPFILGTWDDHDFGGNDMGNRMPDKEARRDAFWQFLDYPPGPPPPDHTNNDPAPEQRRLGVYHSVSFGTPPRQVKLVFLDTRTYRDDHCGIPSMATWFPLGAGVACATRWLTAGLLPSYCRRRSATVLGAAQWEWLEQELTASEASLHIILSSVQVLSTNPVMEGWCHFPSERTRLLTLLQNTTGALLLSGDVHYAEVLDAVSPLVTEVTSSGLTHVCTKHIYGAICQPLLEGFAAHRSDPKGYYIGRNFGSLDIDWDAGQVQVKIHDAISGSVVLQTEALPIIGRTPPAMDAAMIDEIPTCMDGHLIPLAATVLFGMTFLLVPLMWRHWR